MDKLMGFCLGRDLSWRLISIWSAGMECGVKEGYDCEFWAGN